MRGINYVKMLIVVICLLFNSSCGTDAINFEDWKDPVKLKNNETLTIVFNTPHPKYLAIQNENGRWYYFHNNSDSDIILKDEYKVNPEYLIGTYYEDGERFEQIVFSKSGKYILYFADNLETEPENTFSMEKYIEYVYDK